MSLVDNQKGAKAMVQSQSGNSLQGSCSSHSSHLYLDLVTSTGSHGLAPPIIPVKAKAKLAILARTHLLDISPTVSQGAH